MKIFFLITYLFFASCLTEPNQSNVTGQTLPADLISRIKQTAVFIKVSHHFPITGSEVSTTGSGFFITPHGHVVTNYHVIQAQIIHYNISYPTIIDRISIYVNSGTKEYKVYSATIFSVDQENDVAVLEINIPLGGATGGLTGAGDVKYLETDTLTGLSESSPVWVFGYPFGEAFSIMQRGPEITISRGSVTSLRHDDLNTLTGIQFDATVNPGNSGGPLINQEGKAIGIVNISGGTTRMNFAVPVHFLNKLNEKSLLLSSPDDSLTISFNSQPEGAAVFIDWEYAGTTPVNAVKVKRGWKNLCMMKSNFKTLMENLTFNENKTIFQTLSEVRPIHVGDVKTNEKNMPDTSANNPENFQNDTQDVVLLEENFNDESRFMDWEQSTGGLANRTWYIEEGILHQHESNELLHAIFLGDSVFGDYMMRAKVRINNNEEGDSRAGLIFRETKDGFYLFRIHRKTHKAQLAYHCKKPFGWFVLLEKNLPDAIGEKWLSVGVRTLGNNISCYIDSNTVFSTVAEYSDRGRLGFYSVESRASFDSMYVTGNPAYSPIPHTTTGSSSLNSFWFTDYFNTESTWWYQNNGAPDHPSSWRFSPDAGSIQKASDDVKRNLEFTKYTMREFRMQVTISLGEGDKNSIFEIIFDKREEKSHVLRFVKESGKVILVSIRSGEEKILESKVLPENFFNRTLIITLSVQNDGIACLEGGSNASGLSGKLIEYRRKNFLSDNGNIGFSTRALPVVLHQMTVNSIR